MRHLVWSALVAVGFAVAACGGPQKDPMVPDQPVDPSLLGDGGADTPTTSAPAPVAPAQPK